MCENGNVQMGANKLEHADGRVHMRGCDWKGERERGNGSMANGIEERMTFKFSYLHGMVNRGVIICFIIC